MECDGIMNIIFSNMLISCIRYYRNMQYLSYGPNPVISGSPLV